MNYQKYLFTNTFIIILLSVLLGCSQNNPTKQKNITVEIAYNQELPVKKHQIDAKEGLTALEALQHVAHVETYPKGSHVFVTAIDTVKGIRGNKGWYYKVNGEPAEKLAIHNQLKPGDRVRWIYKKDVCSQKVDNQTSEQVKKESNKE